LLLQFLSHNKIPLYVSWNSFVVLKTSTDTPDSEIPAKQISWRY